MEDSRNSRGNGKGREKGKGGKKEQKRKGGNGKEKNGKRERNQLLTRGISASTSNALPKFSKVNNPPQRLWARQSPLRIPGVNSQQNSGNVLSQ